MNCHTPRPQTSTGSVALNKQNIPQTGNVLVPSTPDQLAGGPPPIVNLDSRWPIAPFPGDKLNKPVAVAPIGWSTPAAPSFWAQGSNGAQHSAYTPIWPAATGASSESITKQSAPIP